MYTYSLEHAEPDYGGHHQADITGRLQMPRQELWTGYAASAGRIVLNEPSRHPWQHTGLNERVWHLFVISMTFNKALDDTLADTGLRRCYKARRLHQQSLDAASSWDA